MKLDKIIPMKADDRSLRYQPVVKVVPSSSSLMKFNAQKLTLK